MNSKKCSTCKSVKKVTDFYSNRKSPDGLQARCKECFKESNKRYYSSNREKLLNDQRDKAEEIAQRKAAWFQNNKDRVRVNSYKWRSKNKDRVSGYSGTRRAKILEATVDGSLPSEYRKIILSEFGETCMRPNCTKEITAGNPLTIDHVVPFSLGGTHSMDNMQVLCKSCNSAKGGRSCADYRQGKILFD